MLILGKDTAYALWNRLIKRGGDFMKILILGGTRFLGRFLVKAAIEKGHDVTLFNRGSDPDIFREIEQIRGDRDGGLETLEGRQWDAVIDTSGFIPRTVSKSSRLLKQVNHYTYISSISVYKDPINPGIDENGEVQTLKDEDVEEVTRGTAGPIYGEYYGPLKSLGERAAEKELPGKVLSIRAGQIVGPYDYTDRLPYWIKRIAEGGEILSPGRPDRPIQIIDARDLAQWIIQMIEKNITGVFNATGPDYTLTMGQLLENCKKITRSNADFTWVSEKFLLDNKVEPWGEMPLWIPEDFPLAGGKEPLNGFLAVANKKAINNGLTFRPLSETLEDTWNWEKGRPESANRKAGMHIKYEHDLLRLWNQTVG
ncbi:NAD-dependent epimerase/dehydratase family protein [Peribacillus muralis]|uniref:NAD-dependent epimerase/dehydratase family protein n=1 Tax=Peribacillus muralis TaxID=264697 RepID=UPI002E80099B|nr:NAD-dependent epimerase/dehydratase family protein [Peribacillus muralis]